MINNYSIVGEVAESATTLPNGGYAKLRLKLTNSLNRTEIVEVVSKVGDWTSTATPGSIVAVSGSVGGKINDKGYLYLSLWARDIILVTASSGKIDPPFDENDDVPY